MPNPVIFGDICIDNQILYNISPLNGLDISASMLMRDPIFINAVALATNISAVRLNPLVQQETQGLCSLAMDCC